MLKSSASNESDQDTVVFGMKGTIPFSDPNHVVEMSFQFNNVTFVKPGLHCIEFFLQRRTHLAKPV